MSLLGFDIGTTGCRAVATSAAGLILHRASREYPTVVARPGWSELEPGQVWAHVKELLREMADATRRDPVEAISVSAMGDTVTPLDEHLSPTYNSILAFDTRSVAEAHYLGERLGREWLFQVTGMPLHATYSASKILWVRNHMSQVFERSRKFLCYEDLILVWLGAQPALSYSSAARTMLLDIANRAWRPEILEVCGISSEQLAVPERSGIVVGQLDRRLADEVGMPGNVVLVTGGHDQPCGALACGAVTDGIAVDTTGTVEVLLVSFDQPILTSSMLEANICCYPHAHPGRYCAFGQITTGGAALRWFRDRFGSQDCAEGEELGIDPYDIITSKLPAQTQDLYFVPYLSGSGTPTMDPLARGCLYGLALSTDRYDIARAILEGVTYELRINVELMESLGIKVDALRATGGGAKSDVWLQLKADITGKPIVANRFVEVGALGAALLAGCGSGAFATVEEAIQAVRLPVQTFHPDPRRHEAYQERFASYLILRETTNGLHRRIQPPA